MSDLLVRIEQALTDIEATARAASDCGEAWTHNKGGGEAWLITGTKSGSAYGTSVVVYDEGAPNDEQAAHIAAWDPARVLGLVAGARKLLELHAGTTAYVPRDVGTACISCGTNDEYPTEWPCPTILAVAEMLGVEVPEPAQEGT